ncbi:MAG: hypothetical protein LWX83_13495, partial [Anaerolineae bacterium]|nr:hypothetical protein [Anaerolineae bacterium]
EGETMIVMLNSADETVPVDLTLPVFSGVLKDLLNPTDTFIFNNGKVKIPLNANWGRILRVETD